MDKSEFEMWKKETARSASEWVQDAATLYNSGDVLVYKGGSNGTYIRIETDGRTSIGYYEGAIPHIGESIFSEKYAKTFPSQIDAIGVVFEKLGYGRLAAVVAIMGKIPA